MAREVRSGTLSLAGAVRPLVLGGVPAFAMMAFGMGAIEPVDIICGAGNKYVAEAKRQPFGRCGIDLLAGPTEILVIADDAADPALVACDLLGQAEHDPNSGMALICLSEHFARACLAEVGHIAAAAVFLASEEAAMANCHTLCVDGGWTAW